MVAIRKLKYTAEEKRSLLGGGSEPKIDPENYIASLMRALNWYNANVDRKVRTKYGVDYAKKVLQIDLSECPDSDFITYGFVARLVSRGEPIKQDSIAGLNQYFLWMNKRNVFENSLKIVDIPDEPVVKIQRKTADDVANEQANEFIEEIEQFIDQNLYTPGTFDFPESFFKRVQSPKVATIIRDFFQKRLHEINEVKAGKDDQLNEGYSFMNRRKINHYSKLLEQLVSEASTQTAIAKVEKARKPRAKKEKPASVLVKGLKYLKKDDDLNIQSLEPETIVGATQVTLYNTKRRCLVVVEALVGQTLSVKGTTIINNDPEKTLAKRVRKPEAMLTDFIRATKRNTATAFKAIKTTENKSASRVSEDVLILAVNK